MTEQEQMQEENNKKEKKQKKWIICRLVSYLSLLCLPVLLLYLTVFTLLTNSNFYTSILKKSDIVATYIKYRNIEMDKKIEREIEKKVQLKQYKKKFEEIKNKYKKTKEMYRALNKNDDFERLNKQRDELDDLDWERAPGSFATEKDFNKYKKGELKRLASVIEGIEEYRDKNEDEIAKAEDELDDEKDKYEDAKDILKDKKEKAGDIIDDYKNSFSEKIYADIETISPMLTGILNERLIEKNIKKQIEKILSFMSSYDEQKRYGNVYNDRFSFIKGAVDDNFKIRLPRITLSLWIEEKKHGVLQRRHLLSQIFVEEIRKFRDLNNRSLFINLFRFADTGLAESFSKSYLKDHGLSIRNGIISLKQIVLEGHNARPLQIVMIILSDSKYLKYIVPGLIILFILFLIFSSAGGLDKLNSMKRVLIYPSLLFIIIGIAGIAVSRFILDFYPQLFADISFQSFAGSILFITGLHFFGPIIAVFGILLFFGLIIRKVRNGKLMNE